MSDNFPFGGPYTVHVLPATTPAPSTMRKLRFSTVHAIDFARVFEFHAEAGALPYFKSVEHVQREYVPGVVTNTFVWFEAPLDLVEAVVKYDSQQMPSFTYCLLPEGIVLPAQRPVGDLPSAVQVSRRNSASTHVPSSSDAVTDNRMAASTMDSGFRVPTTPQQQPASSPAFDAASSRAANKGRSSRKLNPARNNAYNKSIAAILDIRHEKVTVKVANDKKSRSRKDEFGSDIPNQSDQRIV